MNLLGTRGLNMLIDELRTEAAKKGRRDGNLQDRLKDAADTLAAADKYWCAVETALV